MTDVRVEPNLLEAPGTCGNFRGILHRYLDQAMEEDVELVGQAAFVAHMATCTSCRQALLQYSRHIQAHRILAADGRLDPESIRSLEQSIPSEFALISERVVRKRARDLGRLKFQIMQVYLKAVLSEHAYPAVLSNEELKAAEAASHALVDNIERYKESNIIFAEGGMVNLRTILDDPLDSQSEGLEAQLRFIARGLLTARMLDPSVDEYVLHHLGVILEKLGYYTEARQMFLTLAQITPKIRPHLRAQALNSAGRTSFRFLEDFEEARAYLEEAGRLYPNRWTIEYNLATYYLWPTNPERDTEKAAIYFEACQKHVRSAAQLENLVSQDSTARQLFEKAGFLLRLPS